MSGNWRISTFNGALLAAYFIPAWTIAAFNIILSPIHGLYERPNISLALFVSDHLQLSGIATVRVALLLALGRITRGGVSCGVSGFRRPRLDPQERRLP
jgi:hypothetical protein